MAIAPNVTFVSGAVLTAAQQNAFGFGVVAYTESTTSPSNVGTTEATVLTGLSFTAIANRYYKVTYMEPQTFTASGAPALLLCRIRLTNLAGTVKLLAYKSAAGINTQDNYVMIQYVGTLTAGSTNFVVTGQSSTVSTTFGLSRSATQVAYLLVEDIGPA